MSDWELLQEYARTASQEAFTELVSRHIDWVHSAALRKVRDAHLAEDVAQAAFIALAQSAGKLRPNTVVSAWLFGVVRYASASALRAQKRRQTHEKEAAMLRSMSESRPAAWERIAPVLEEAVGCLRKADQEAVLLRFYQRKSFAEVAAAVGGTEESVRKRIGRALEKLRGWLTRRGVDVSGETLGAAMLTHAALEAGMQLAPSTAAAAMAAAAGTATNAQAVLICKGAQTMMALAKAKMAAMVVAMVVALVIVITAPVAIYCAMAAPVERPAAAAPAAAANALPVAPGENAATLYRQAFALLPKVGLDADTLNHWDTIQPETALDMLMRLEPANNLVRRAAGIRQADWGWELSQAGVSRALGDLNNVKALSRLAALRARYLKTRQADVAVVQDLVAVFMMSRHVGTAPMMLSRMAAVGIEMMAINEAAGHLPKLAPKAVEELVKNLDALPALPSLGQMVLGEKKLAGAILIVMTKELAAFYDHMAQAVDLPPDKFDGAWAQLQKEAAGAGPFAATLLPAIRQARQQEDRMLATRTMFKAAIVRQTEGEEAFQRIKDPFGKGPFTYRKLAGGWVLESKLMVNGKPISLTVGQRTP
jgi:RNA polymerase sigma factor (sigma-70 family)